MGNKSSGILSYMRCRKCVSTGRKDRLSAGLVDPTTMRLWCSTCESKVADFPLAIRIEPRCDICGEPIREGHVH
jgi:hypothetical protein